MKPTNQSTTLSLTQICEAHEKLVKDAAATEAAVNVATEEYKVAKIDDGKTDPAEIFDRKTAAKKKLFICEAEAKRAAARLEGAEADFNSTIESLAAPLLENLTNVRNCNAAKLTKELEPKLAPGDLRVPALANFVARCNGVVEFDVAIASIHNGVMRLEERGAQASGLIGALKQAERLI